MTIMVIIPISTTITTPHNNTGTNPKPNQHHRPNHQIYHPPPPTSPSVVFSRPRNGIWSESLHSLLPTKPLWPQLLHQPHLCSKMPRSPQSQYPKSPFSSSPASPAPSSPPKRIKIFTPKIGLWRGCRRCIRSSRIGPN